jgi:hypothetical protein
MYSAGDDPTCVNKIDSDRCKHDVNSDGKIDGFCAWGTWYDCDSNVGDCGFCGYYWINTGDGDIGEYYQGSNPNYPASCCGDDSGEYKGKMESGYDDTWRNFMGGDNPSDSACCNEDYGCVYQGRCYPAGDDPAAGDYPYCPNPVDADRCKFDVNDDGKIDGFCAWESWYDCDSNVEDCGFCGYNWVRTGDGNIGEYYQGSNPNYPVSCCGDDADEDYITCRQASNEDVCDRSYVDEACCNVNTDCVSDAVCYSNRHKADVDDDGSGEECSNGMWIRTRRVGGGGGKNYFMDLTNTNITIILITLIVIIVIFYGISKFFVKKKY